VFVSTQSILNLRHTSQKAALIQTVLAYGAPP